MEQLLNLPLPDAVTVNDKTYKINLAFNRVLSVLELLKDDNWSTAQAYDIIYEWLVVSPVKKIGISERIAVVETIFEKFLVSENSSDRKKPPVLSFSQDAKYIYAAFQEAYGINLFAEQDRLSWWEFTALLGSLPSNTRLSQIVRIRDMDVPHFNGKNGAEIDRIAKLKAEYAIRNKEQPSSQEGLNSLFDMLKAKAMEKG